jgi:mannose-6-phosphate isomerase-like protein (cupin superfamily)
MNKPKDLRPFLVDPPSDVGFTTASWGEYARARIRSVETEGRLSVLVYRAPAGFGPPRHLHRRDDEIFLIEQGTVVLWTLYECRTAKSGDMVMLPRCVLHTWRACGNDPVWLQVTVAPGEFKTFFERIIERHLTLANHAELADPGRSSSHHPAQPSRLRTCGLTPRSRPPLE